MISSAPWPLPPYVQIADFLPDPLNDALLSWVLDKQRDFKRATVTFWEVGSKARVDEDVRIARTLRDLGPFEQPLSKAFLAVLPTLMANLRMRGPQPRSLEMELAAHGDGAHYDAHIDISIGANRRPLGAREGEDRALSAVYYFFNRPKRFHGGALRLYRFGASSDTENSTEDYVDIEPIHNSLVAFLPWTTHAVQPVQCPTKKFEDSRFALNCWFCRKD